MSTQSSPKNATSGQQASKPLTPAQTAKPYGTAAKNAASSVTKKAESHATEQASDIANDDTVKAIEKLETRIKAVNANSIARVANSQMTDPEEKLHPLLSLKTGKPIEKFPPTPASISKLGLTQIDSLLNTLDADRSGNEEAKRERLRLQVGLKPKPV
ncbi:hypothetical protein KC332_g4910 [Hortaea werneckii]|uniref:Uncharacterized protein n=1 Tax=Hortaea werneckii EXF-2000 TaxID=1157616 RepID=A0A1Z5SZM8_HORWE|nr:hypothetical protein KC358_g7900 [Hortaea werneckii]OTA27739.1 hypothetical protein BTJ68_10786 [Hortaea werneckii EXF-2000]KAI6837406.1 hypothetical protein KC350_g6063 [Hortaea werneckii]KAI6910260.1 hypothetical protein KC348_g13270 [Hortaea werneckii]KAI6936226.1 hypothetical protein KC341_g6379 [Hortaea werneckii]